MPKIIIAEDDYQNRSMLETLLKAYGYDVLSASNGREALLMARRELPDMIISDIQMPVMDGFMLCREWKKDKTLKAIPFIFYTATYTVPADEAFAMNLGAVCFLFKPQQPDELARKLRYIIEENKHNKPVMSEPLLNDDIAFTRGYHEVLIRKLENKVKNMLKH